MPTLFPSYDGCLLAYHLIGKGPFLVCVPGGPGRASSYLDNLGGLDEHFTLVMLDNRGTGDSDDASDVDSYQVQRLAHDVDELRKHLGLEAIDLLGHSGGAQIAVYFAAAYPQRLTSLLLLNSGHRLVGAEIEGSFDTALAARADELWFPEARRVSDQWQGLGPAAAMLSNVTYVEQPGAGHFPWVDDPAYFTRAVAGWFLGGRA